MWSKISLAWQKKPGLTNLETLRWGTFTFFNSDACTCGVVRAVEHFGCNCSKIVPRQLASKKILSIIA